MPKLTIYTRAGSAFFLASLVLVAQAPQAGADDARELSVTVGKSLLIDSPVTIQRIAVGNGEVAEATATTPREVLVNGKTAGETSLIVWQQDGNRLIFDLTVLKSSTKVEKVRSQIRTEFDGQDIQVDFEGDAPIVRGVVKDLTTAERALQLAGTLGKPVNFLRVNVPPTDPQILIHVRFADVDRSAQQQLGINFVSGAGRTVASAGSSLFSPPTGSANVDPYGGSGSISLSQALNVFFFRPDLNIGAAIQALQTKNLVQILAEPNVLTLNGHAASFLAGGEFPFPTLQGGGAGLGSVTIQFREFGVRINFVPVVTPRGTIQLEITPEVSSLDYANGLTFQGFTIPGIATRRVSTEIELESGQSFAIGGLLDNRLTESWTKIPGLGDLPFFGKLFRSRQMTKNNSELLVLVTPEIVRPIPAGQSLPQLKMAPEFLAPNTSSVPPQTPPLSVTGPDTAGPVKSIPMEELVKSKQPVQTQQNTPTLQFVPMMIQPGSALQSTQTAPAATAPPSAPVKP